MPRSARNTITLVAESGWPSYQRTASRITSGGQRYPEKAAIEVAVKVRWQGRHMKRWRPAPSRPWRLVAGRPQEEQRGIRRGPYQPQTVSRTPDQRQPALEAAAFGDHDGQRQPAADARTVHRAGRDDDHTGLDEGVSGEIPAKETLDESTRAATAFRQGIGGNASKAL